MRTPCLDEGFCHLGEPHQCVLPLGHRGKHWAHGATCVPLGIAWKTQRNGRPHAKTNFEIWRTVAAIVSVFIQVVILLRVFGWL